MLASLKQELGELERVAGWIKALGFVNCADGFDATPAVINGFSDLILDLWGNAGRHARSAIGASKLPFGVPVQSRRSSRWHDGVNRVRASGHAGPRTTLQLHCMESGSAGVRMLLAMARTSGGAARAFHVLACEPVFEGVRCTAEASSCSRSAPGRS